VIASRIIAQDGISPQHMVTPSGKWRSRPSDRQRLAIDFKSTIPLSGTTHKVSQLTPDGDRIGGMKWEFYAGQQMIRFDR
jgi:hypothetical protein